MHKPLKERYSSEGDRHDSSAGVEVFQRMISTFNPVPLKFGVAHKQAAVSVLHRTDEQGGVEIFFIERATDPNDPWSGHMAFPGGRVEPEDDGTRGAAERETLEEVGVDLMRNARWMGTLSQVRAAAKGKPLPLAITAHVYELEYHVDLTLNEEVASTLWVPFSFFLNTSNRANMTYRVAGVSRELPCYHFRDKTIWGLTLRMLEQLIDAYPSASKTEHV